MLGSGSVLHSFVIAQILGLYMVLMAIVLLSRSQYYRALFLKTKEPGLDVFLHSSIGLLIGILLVAFHNVWEMKLDVIVTIFCWLLMIRSLMWLAIPEHMLQMMKAMCKGAGYYLLIIILGISGFVMMTIGFYLFMNHHGLLHL